jgi:hypothetical protein
MSSPSVRELGAAVGELIRDREIHRAETEIRIAMMDFLCCAYRGKHAESEATDDWEDELDTWPAALVERLTTAINRRKHNV